MKAREHRLGLQLYRRRGPVNNIPLQVVHRVAADANAFARLNKASARLLRIHDLNQGRQEIVSTAIKRLGADFRNIRLLHPKKRVLRFAAPELIIATKH